MTPQDIYQDLFNQHGLIGDGSVAVTEQQLITCLAEHVGKPVYEVIDETGGEVYYPIGLFASEEAADAAITEHFEKHGEPPCYEGSDSDGEGVELVIRRRGFGWGDSFKRFKVRTFMRDWSRNPSDGSQWDETTQ